MKHIIIILILGIFGGCYKTGVTYHSENIEESKKVGAFINEYSFSPKQIKLDSLQFNISGDAWIEHGWYYKNLFGHIALEKYFNMLVSVDSFINHGSEMAQLYFLKDDFRVDRACSTGLTGSEENMRLVVGFFNYPDTIRFNFSNNQQVVFIKKE